VDNSLLTAAIPSDKDIVDGIKASAAEEISDDESADTKIEEIIVHPPSHSQAREALDTLRRYVFSQEGDDSNFVSSLSNLEAFVDSNVTFLQPKITDFFTPQS
jgi:hypothetical protein